MRLVPGVIFGGQVLKALGLDPSQQIVGNIEIVIEPDEPAKVILHRFLREDETPRLLEALARYRLITEEEYRFVSENSRVEYRGLRTPGVSPSS